MMKFAFEKSLTCPDNFRFRFQDGTLIMRNTRQDWFDAIAKHYKDNDIPRPEDWKAQAEHQLCMLLPPGWCMWETGEAAAGLVDARLSMGDIFRGMEVLARIAASPDPLVEQAEAERRAALCSGCFANAHVPGCAPCMKIPDMVASIAGAKTTKSDYLLQSCLVCKCRNSAAVWIKEELLAKGITPDHHRIYQQLDWCWKKDIQPA